MVEEEGAITITIASLKAKGRYLVHLRSEPGDDSENICVICQQVIEVGGLTVCGHQYCKFRTLQRRSRVGLSLTKSQANSASVSGGAQVISAQCAKGDWDLLISIRLRLSKPHPLSPYYKLTTFSLYHSYKPPNLTVYKEPGSNATKRQSNHQQASIYSTISNEALSEIQQIHLDGSYGTKVDTSRSSLSLLLFFTRLAFVSHLL